MSDLATYAFLPWLRRGIAAEIERQDGTLTGEPRVSVPITLALNAAGDARSVTADLALFGPGEVAALDPRAVIRVIPKPGEVDAEPNYFPAAEFDQADLPWRFTPARADASRERLRPWLALAVLAEDEILEETPASGDGRLPAIVATGASLPLLHQSWAWAHVQVDGFDPAAESLDDVVTNQPQRVRSRLLAPRRLLPRTGYRAFLVPTFERGRRAGLHEPIDDTVDALAPAWASDDPSVRLPYYYTWSFQTGEKGDFETLVRRLRARPVDRGVGIRPMDVSTPDPALPSAATEPLALEGALMSPAAEVTPWNPAERDAFVSRLADLLNRQSEALETEGVERTVAPPLWVRWHAKATRLNTEPTARPAWFHELNADPRLRAAAGLGAEVVRRNDQQLMAEAWNQVEGVLEANAELRRAQLSRETSERIFRRHLTPLRTDTFIQLTAPLHARFTLSPETVRAVLRRSPIPEGALTGGMRRVLRPGGGAGRRIARLRQTGAAPLLERLNRGEVRARPPRETPEGMITPDKVVDRLQEEGTFPTYQKVPTHLLLLLILLLVFGLLLFLVVPLLGLLLLGGAAWVGRQVWQIWREGLEPRRRGRVLDWSATPRDIRGMEPAPGFVPATSEPGDWGSAPAAPDLSPTEEAAATARFQDALADLVGEVNAVPAPGPRWEVADLSAISAQLVRKMNPRVTIPAAIQHRLTLGSWVTWQYAEVDPLEPIMAAPHIDTPMYEPLRDLSQEWLMPGVGTIPGDTVTLVVTNPRFIEAYMAGLSHEMARELLYHEYPTDQQGTYFRQFWDVRGMISPSGTPPDPESLRDITPIHSWPASSRLGEHSGRNPVPRDGHLVLLIKAEVLRRYPTTMVYAIRTVLDEHGRRVLSDEYAYPVFEGHLEPDIAFFGFDLLPDEARGDEDPEADQGWYFVLQEQPTEPVFGLDADDGSFGGRPSSWNDLNWSHLASDAATLESLRYIDLDAELPNTSGVVAAPGEPALAWHAESGAGPAGANGSDLAYITLQRPFRVAIHGSDMLPAEAL